jgi:hypothetical protein
MPAVLLLARSPLQAGRSIIKLLPMKTMPEHVPE